MDAVLVHPSNSGVVRCLSRKNGGSTSIASIGACQYPVGHHPDIIGRVWYELGRDLSEDSRLVLCGSPVLVQPSTGVIIALGRGTTYCLRISDRSLSAATQAGYSAIHHWNGDEVTDISQEFGMDWVFGKWAQVEVEWCRADIASHKSA